MSVEIEDLIIRISVASVVAGIAVAAINAASDI